jgi:hypothetical protein
MVLTFGSGGGSLGSVGEVIGSIAFFLLGSYLVFKLRKPSAGSPARWRRGIPMSTFGQIAWIILIQTWGIMLLVFVLAAPPHGSWIVWVFGGAYGILFVAGIYDGRRSVRRDNRPSG